MRRMFTLVSFALALLLWGNVQSASAQNLVAYWNQNSNNLPGGGFGFAPSSFPQAATLGTGSLTVTNFLDTLNASGAYLYLPSFAGTQINQWSGDTATSGGGSFSIQGGLNNGNNGAHLNLAVSLTNQQNPVLSYAAQRTSTGFNVHQISYSTNGTTFTVFRTDTLTGSGTFGVRTVDFTGVTALANASSATFRITFLGATAATGNNRIDNITITAAPNTPQTTSIVTFRVNMANTPVSANGVRVAGNFQGWSPANAVPMTRSMADTNVWMWSDTFNIGDTLQFKYVNGNAWGQDEQVPAACAIGGNRFYVVQAGNPTLPLVCYGACTNCLPVRQVTFRVDMTGQTVATRVNVAGSFNGWNANADTLTPGANNIYSRTFSIQEGTVIQYKFINSGNWESVPAACGVSDNFGGFNRTFTVPANNAVLPAVQFGTCVALVSGNPTLPVRSIASLRGVNASGVADSLNARVAVYGTVVSHNITPAGMQYVIRDNTGGINIFRSSGNFGLGALAIGDSVWAQGTVVQFNGLTQISMSSANGDTCVLVATGRPIPAPLVVPTVSESTENELVRVDSLQIVSGTWPAAGSTSSANIIVRSVNDTTNTFTVRVIANGTNLAGNAPTTPVFSMVGVGGQFDNSSPFTSGYQLLPRSAADIIPVVATVQAQITLQVDMDTFTVRAGGVRVAGNFNGWNPASASAVMTRVGTSSIYQRTITLNAGDTIQYKFLRDSLWSGEELVPAACGVNNGQGGFNRSLVVPGVNTTLPAVIFGTCAPRVQALPIRPIAVIKTNNANGVPDSLGTRQRVTGVLHGRNHYRSTSQPVGVQWILIDGTGGTTVRRAGTTFGVTNWAAGDSVVAEGTVEQFNGLTQINIDTMFRVATGRTLRTPLVVTAPSEATENEYIRINNLNITGGTWPAAGANGTITVSNGTANFQMFIISVLNTPQFPQPTGPFDLIGFGAQNDNSSPFTDVYQIVPMNASDFIPVQVTTPTLNFGRTDTLLTNVTTSFPMFINIVNPVNTAAQVRVRWTATPGVGYGAGATFNTNPAAVSDTITLNVAANATQTGFSFQTFGNVPVGRTDTITFTIVSATGGLNIGALSSSRVRISNPVPPPVTNLTIGQIRGNNTGGVADSINVRVRTSGVVLGFNKRPAGLEFHIFDRASNAGIGIFRATGNIGYNVNEGDSIRVVGTVAQFNGLSQINVDSITIVGTNITLPAPQVVTAMSEATESRLIRINNLSMVNPAQWPTPGATGSGATVRVTNGVDSFDVRIDNDVNLFGSPAPTGVFDMIGIGGQFTTATPRVGGWQLLPRYLADLVTTGGGVDSITNFTLVSPANNTVLTVEGAQSTAITIRWNPARWTGGAANFTYAWLLDLPTGNFTAPVATIPSNTAGSDTALTLTYGQIAAILDAAGVPQGSGVDLKWTVRASRVGATNTKLAVQPFNIRLNRGLMSSVAENNALESMKLYPNPAQGKAYLQYSLQQPANLKLEVINMIGKQVAVEVLHNVSSGVAEIEVANLPEGVYFVRLSNNEMAATRRLVVKR